jgi:hypothetical protein
MDDLKQEILEKLTRLGNDLKEVEKAVKTMSDNPPPAPPQAPAPPPAPASGIRHQASGINPAGGPMPGTSNGNAHRWVSGTKAIK